MCYPLVFEFSVGIGGFVIGLSQISFFFSLTFGPNNSIAVLLRSWLTHVYHHFKSKWKGVIVQKPLFHRQTVIVKQVNPHNVVCRGGGIGYNNNQTKLKNINHQNTSPTCFLINDEIFALFLKASKLKKNFIKKGALLWPIPRFIPKLTWPGNACRKLRILYSYTFSQVNHGKVKNVKSVCRWKIKLLPPPPHLHTDPWSILNGFFIELWPS